MDRAVKPLLFCLAGMMLAGGVHAAITNGNFNAYKVIIDRNPFALRPLPPPAPAKVEEKLAPPPTEVNLTGITSMMGKTKAYLVAKERGKSETQYLSMAEGEKQGVLEVLEINEKAGTVKIKNSDQEMVLNFQDNGVKTVAMAGGVPKPPLPSAAPGARPMIGLPPHNATPGPQPVPLMVPGQHNNSGNSPEPSFQRIPRLAPGQTTSQNTVTVPHPPQASLTAEESIVLVAAQTEAKADEIKQGTFPPLPPTPLTPDPPMPPLPGR